MKIKIEKALSWIQSTEKCRREEAITMLALWIVLAAMSRIEECYEQLVVKGGTILRLRNQSPIGRVSKDLDASLLMHADAFRPELITEDVKAQVDSILRDHFDDPATISIVLKKTPDDAKNGNTRLYVYRLYAQVGTTRAENKGFKIEIATDEWVDLSQVEDFVALPLSPLGLQMGIRIQAYTCLQAVSEKLRAILQKRQHFDWNPNPSNWEPRHVMDLLFLRQKLSSDDLDLLPEIFNRKCECKGIDPSYRSIAHLTDQRLLDAVQGVVGDSEKATPYWDVLVEFAGLVASDGK